MSGGVEVSGASTARAEAAAGVGVAESVEISRSRCTP